MKNKTFWICIIIWVVITLLRVIYHQPWTDEAWAWVIAKKFNFIELLAYLKNEGHTFVWYTLLMPFAKNDLFYPYSMLLINWFFCFGAIFTLWKYSPFNNLLKIAITFSFPFFVYYPVVARCYSVGIFLIFILTAMFKDKIKHPIIYAILVLICANTSVMAGIGAFCFGAFLAFDLVKNKQWKDFYICSGIAVLCLVLIGIQFIGVDKRIIKTVMLTGLSKEFFLNVFIFSQWINAVLLIVFGILLTKIFYENKKALIFILISYSALLFVFNFWYSGDLWHHYFFYIYLLCAGWICMSDENLKPKSKKILSVVLIIISVLFIFEYKYEPRIFNSKSKVLAEFIKEHQNSRIIFFDHIFLCTIPYLNQSDYEIYDFEINGLIDKPLTDKIRNREINYESVKKTLSFNKENYAFFNECSPKEDLHQGKNKIIFKLVKNVNNGYCIYRVKF